MTHTLPTHAVEAVLFDMDGVLYDSMPRHATAWMEMCRKTGIEASYDEFFGYEGRTGVSTIQLLTERQFGKAVSEAQAKAMYAIKSAAFAAMDPAPVMPGAQEAVQAVMEAGAAPVLVTGSGQKTLLERLERDFPGAFAPRLRVTAFDVTHGKPHPEPYLKGLAKAGTTAQRALAIDNAPLGVASASQAGIYTIGAKTGPIAAGELLKGGADEEIAGMEAVAARLRHILGSLR